ncbi:restriction endonuclease [Modestobacter versicolor]|uniref:restriction endonuclease n=1 Tax=Modestobacter versicolor TaxID=429133 RepID=UPI0034DEAB07
MAVTSTAVEIKFDPDQSFQHDAITAVLDLFKGQPLASTTFEIHDTGEQTSLQTEYGIGNVLHVADEQIRVSLDEVQRRNDIPAAFRGDAGDEPLISRDFSVEMETGTGKTYVQIRTAFELNRVYGFTKFVVVVPSVAIREGVEANLRLLKTHLAALYDGVQYNTMTYDSKNPTRLRSFAQANHLQILIINIDAFNKADINRIYQSQDQMMGHAPIDFIQACAPIVILDEPQNMVSDTAKRAIASLNPLVTLRYSATHRETYHQVYRLTPVDAYNLGLVKRIDVWSVMEDDNTNRPHIRLAKITAAKRGVSAQVEVDALSQNGVTRKKITCGPLKDLKKATDRDIYAGYVVEEINAATQTLLFTNGVEIKAGETIGPDRNLVQRTQIRTAIAQHLDRELDIRRRVEAGEMAPTKVLSLFFIDRVANYWPADGKFRTWFEEEYSKAAALPKYASLSLPPVSEVHDGYFAVDKKDVAKDTSGATKDDDRAYELIMRDKQRLLSVDEPLRFIFSHSALREGWDNPNVFVICTLNDTHSETKKRQEIGRGLRLPVTADGTRCTNPDVARLAVVANESYEEFANTLQREIEDDTGVAFPRSNIKKGKDRKTVKVRKGYDTDQHFIDLWNKVKHRTTYKVVYDTDDLIKAAGEALAAKPTLAGSYIRAQKATVSMDAKEGVTTQWTAEKTPVEVQSAYPIPDLLGHLSRLLPVSRSTIAQILIQSGRLDDAAINPQQFLDYAKDAISHALAELLVDGITYERLGDGPDAVYEMRLFEQRELTGYVDNLVPVNRSIYQEVVYDSDPEKDFAEALDVREDIKVFIKLPGWFTVETPVGPYNPDWAILKEDEDGTNRLYLVAESKPTRDVSKLRADERLKTQFGEKHFNAIDVHYKVVKVASDIDD